MDTLSSLPSSSPGRDLPKFSEESHSQGVVRDRGRLKACRQSMGGLAVTWVGGLARDRFPKRVSVRQQTHQYARALCQGSACDK